MGFKELELKSWNWNPAYAIGEDWWLITAGTNETGYNAMTAAWGQIGSLWGRPTPGETSAFPVATVYVRPQRYTREFLDRESLFTLSVFGPEARKALGYLGTHSGRDGDKLAKVGLTPVFDRGSTYFAEAKTVLVCRKLYRAPLVEEGFVDGSIIEKNYPLRDYHEVYIGEILSVLERERD